MVLSFKSTVLLCCIVFLAYCVIDLVFEIIKEVIRGKVQISNLNKQIDAAVAKIARVIADLVKKKEGPDNEM